MAAAGRFQRKPGWSRTQLLRRLSQFGFGLFAISSIRHNLVTSEHVASVTRSKSNQIQIIFNNF